MPPGTDPGTAGSAPEGPFKEMLRQGHMARFGREWSSEMGVKGVRGWRGGRVGNVKLTGILSYEQEPSNGRKHLFILPGWQGRCLAFLPVSEPGT